MSDPAWLPLARDFCKQKGITVMAWGPELLTVEATSPARAHEIAAQLAPLGFKVIPSEEDTAAGMLSLSPNPDAVRAKVAEFPIARRLWGEQIEPLIWLFCGSCFLYSGITRTGRYPWQMMLALGITSLLLFVWDALRIWSWRLELLPEGIHIRRLGRWHTISWNEIQRIETERAPIGRRLKRVTLYLSSDGSERLGTFVDAFAINLRDRLRIEVEQRRGHSGFASTGN
jgi:membrane protein YdbS with pleckstrin-like domain